MSSQRSIDQTSAPEFTQRGCRKESHGPAHPIKFHALILLMCALCWSPIEHFPYQPDRSPIAPEMAPTISTLTLACGIRTYAVCLIRSSFERRDGTRRHGHHTTGLGWASEVGRD